MKGLVDRVVNAFEGWRVCEVEGSKEAETGYPVMPLPGKLSRGVGLIKLVCKPVKFVNDGPMCGNVWLHEKDMHVGRLVCSLGR